MRLLAGIVFAAMAALASPDTTAAELPKCFAHAGGEIAGEVYTNSVQAVESSYAKGFRAIELDFSLTSDGNLIAAHDWHKNLLKRLTWSNALFWKTLWARIQGRSYRPSLSELDGATFRHGLEPVRVEWISKFLIEHRDVTLMADLKDDSTRLLTKIASLDGFRPEQWIPEVSTESALKQAWRLGFTQVFFGIYQDKKDLDRALAIPGFAENQNISLMLPETSMDIPDFAAAIQRTGKKSYAYTVNNEQRYRALIDEMGVTGILTDRLNCFGTVK